MSTRPGVSRVFELLREMTEEEWLDLSWMLKRAGIDLHEKTWVGTPQEALELAELQGGSDRLRRVASEACGCAVGYATVVDGGPHEVTRAGVRDSPRMALHYARRVDCGPHEVTRRAVCDGDDPGAVYIYALHVDGGWHADTEAAVRGTQYEAAYAADVPREMSDE